MLDRIPQSRDAGASSKHSFIFKAGDVERDYLDFKEMAADAAAALVAAMAGIATSTVTVQQTGN